MKRIRLAIFAWLVLPLAPLIPAGVIAEPARATEPSAPVATASPRTEPRAVQRVDAPRGARPAVAPKLPAAEQALLDIQEQGRLQVEEINRRALALPDGPGRRELQRRAVEVKRDHLVRFLQARAALDRTRGDQTSALQAEAMIEQILHPRVTPIAGSPRADKSAPAKGGRP